MVASDICLSIYYEEASAKATMIWACTTVVTINLCELCLNHENMKGTEVCAVADERLHAGIFF